MNPMYKIAGLLLSLIILVIIYSMITEIHTIEEFIEGNEYNDCKMKAKQKVQEILNMPIATKDSNSARPDPQDMVKRIKQVQIDVENGLGDFEGNSYKCFPSEIAIHLDLRSVDPYETLQQIQIELTKKNE